MDTQNTPVHIRLWHKDFWKLLFSNLLITTAVYLFLPILPLWMCDYLNLELSKAALPYLAYAVGLFVLGGFSSHLVERYRRGKVCLSAFMALMVCVVAVTFLEKISPTDRYGVIIAGAFLVGCFFGLSQTVLYGTLSIDISESFQRTEANHVIMWFGRFALSLGPVLGLMLWQNYGFRYVVYCSLTLGVAASLLLAMIKFSFKTPSECDSMFSLDRFLLPKALWLFLNEFLVMTAVGMVLSTGMSMRFYSFLMLGFFLALLAERFAFADANLKSEMTSGLILIIASLLLLQVGPAGGRQMFVPVMIGMGIGLTGARLLLFSVKLRGHCERGKALSNYFHSWESGLALGMAFGLLMNGEARSCYWGALGLSILSLLLYHFVVHPWYMKNKTK